MKPICGLFALSLALLIGCGEKAPKQQANQPETNPPTQPPAKPKVELTKATVTPGMKAAKKAPEHQADVPTPNPPVEPQAKPPVKPKVAAKQPPVKSGEENAPPPSQSVEPPAEGGPIEATLTPGIKAALKANEAGNSQEAVRLFTMELAAEETKSAPSWVQLSYLHQGLGEALSRADQYDKALKYYRKSLAINLKQLGTDHPHVASSYNSTGLVHDNKGEYDKALEYYQKSLAIKLKQMGADHPSVATSYSNMAYTYKAKKDLPKAKEYWEKAYAIRLKRLRPNHPDTKDTKAKLDALNK